MNVRPERSGWRDEGISRRHREWGWDAPAVDIDFLMVEYDKGKPCALVEYKHENAAPADPRHPSFTAIRGLADSAKIPFFGCRYCADYSKFLAVPLNSYAREYMPARQELTERGWVDLLYRVRNRKAPTPKDTF